MEIYDVVSNTDSKIVLKDERQLQSLYDEIVEERNVMIRWEEKGENDNEDEVLVKQSKLLVTEGLMARIKDGRFILEQRSEEEIKE